MRKLSWFSLFFGLAAAAYVGLLSPVWGFTLGGVSLGVFVAAMCVKRGWSHVALAALGLALGLAWCTGFDAYFHAPVRALEGQTHSFTAILRDDPQPTDYGARVYADARIGGVRCRILLYFDDPLPARCGDRVELTARLVAPGGEDYDLYYRSIGVDLIAYSRPGEQTLHVDSNSAKIIPLRLRRMLKDEISALFPGDTVPFLHALLLGDRSGLSYAQKNALSVSGIAHTVAISGMHLSVLLGLVLLLCGNRRWPCALMGIPLILIFTLMVGAQPSIVRAAVMQTLLLLAPLLMRENDPLTSLGVAGLCILVPNPWAVANLSFQLSFGSMLGIVLFSGKIYSLLSAPSPVKAAMKNRFARPLVRYGICTAASTCGACVFTIPFLAWQFGMVSLMSFLTNLLTLWAVTLSFSGAMIVCILGLVWVWPARILGWLIAWPVRYILYVAGLVARMPLSAVYTDNVYMIFWLVFLYLALGLCLWRGRKRLALPCACAGMLALCLCLWLGYLDGGQGGLQMTMLDVGQGQCLIFESGGVTLLYDCGGTKPEEAGEAATRYLLSHSLERVDILILSHYDLDHVGGVCQLLQRVAVDTLYLPDIPCDTALREEIEACALDRGSTLHYVTQDETLTFGDSTAAVFAPMDTGDENDASLALLYSQGDYDILATGDMSAGAERRLLGRNRFPDIEVLVAGHHGASSSTCATLLEQTTPETVLISVGEGNSYGHPAQDTLMRIEELGAQILRTDLCGTITIRR